MIKPIIKQMLRLYAGVIAYLYVPWLLITQKAPDLLEVAGIAAGTVTGTLIGKLIRRLIRRWRNRNDNNSDGNYYSRTVCALCGKEIEPGAALWCEECGALFCSGSCERQHGCPREGED